MPLEQQPDQKPEQTPSPSKKLLTLEQQKEQENKFLIVTPNRASKRKESETAKKERLLANLSRPTRKPTLEGHPIPSMMQQAETAIARIERIGTNVIDFIPVLGSIKMIAEGIRGKQFATGKSIEGKSRLVHGISGVAFLALDITGIGAIASELGKGGLKIGARILEKETLAKIAETTLAHEELPRLIVRGEQRISKKEALAENKERMIKQEV